jgi:uracil-DNA glycosylase
VDDASTDWPRILALYDHLVHLNPSPRNRIWLRRNAWFERDVIPKLRARVARILR